MPALETIAKRWSAILQRVAQTEKSAGRSPGSVRVLAVSKAFPAQAVVEAYEAGARLFGENYVQEALPKIEAVAASGKCPEAVWHFIGALQSNKAKQVVGKFVLIHSLDRWSLAAELDKASKNAGTLVRCLVEVNVAGETSKSGISPEEGPALIRRISKETSLHVDGLMAFRPIQEDPENSRPFFRQTKELGSKIASEGLARISMAELSMGVTSDFEVAIQEGATLIRIGTAIFGPRSAGGK